MEFIFVFLIVIIVVFLVISNKSSNMKNPAMKKEEIIAQYENDLRSLMKRYQNNKTKQVEQKKIFLQNCNNEFSRNIFFTEEEAIKIIQKLAKI